jgi:hypothetical protein
MGFGSQIRALSEVQRQQADKIDALEKAVVRLENTPCLVVSDNATQSVIAVLSGYDLISKADNFKPRFGYYSLSLSRLRNEEHADQCDSSLPTR